MSGIKSPYPPVIRGIGVWGEGVWNSPLTPALPCVKGRGGINNLTVNKKRRIFMPTRVANETLAEVMDRYATVGDPALCWAEGDRLRCVACGHRCLIGEGLRGICKVRKNEGGQLKVPFGYVAGVQCDPVEKKPFFHVYPSSDALTFGMLGCDLHCSYCQNWFTSQSLRDLDARGAAQPVTPGQLVGSALRERARL